MLGSSTYMNRLKLLGFLLFITTVLCITHITMSNSTVEAYDSSNLIDNAMFLDSTSMTPSSIQSFLVSKNSGLASRNYLLNCYGPTSPERQWYTNAGAPCDQTIPAAHVIYYSAQVYGINPKVIIATLQKEQSLITSPNPTSWQVNQAMGYACPTSGSCTNDSSFFYQIDNGTWALRYHYERANGNNTWWNNGGYVCGTPKSYYSQGLYPGNNVTFIDEDGVSYNTFRIANAATAAMYCYTPHTYNNHPNGAPNSDYPAGTLCYPYSPHIAMGYRGRCYTGSYNFVFWFENWFGSTSGYLIRTYEDGKIYIRGADNTYYYITSADQLNAFGYGYALRNILDTSRSYLNSMVYAGDLPTSVRFGNSSDVYGIDNGKKYYFTLSSYQAYGNPAVGKLPSTLANVYASGTAMETVLKQRDGEEIYYVQGGKKRHIGSPALYNATYASQPSVMLSRYFANSIATGAPILPVGTITKTSDTNVYAVVNDGGTSQQKIDSSTGSTFNISTYTSHSTILNQLSRTDPIIGSLVKDASNNLYILDGGHKTYLTFAQFSSSGYLASDFTLAPGSLLSKFATSTPAGTKLLVRSNSTSPVYEIRNKQLWHIPTLADFNGLGYSFNNVVDLKSATVSKLFVNQGLKVLAPGSLFRIGTNKNVYIVDGPSSTKQIPSATVFDSYRFSYANVLSVSQIAANNYPVSSTLTQYVKDPTGTSYWVVDNGKRYWLSGASADMDFKVSGPTTYQDNGRILKPLAIGKNMTRFIKYSNVSTVYYIDNGAKRALSLQEFNSLSGNWSQVITMSDGFMNSLGNM